jgi:hypothetical protein
LITLRSPNDPIVTANPVDKNGNGVTDFGDDLVVRVNWNYTFLVVPNLPGVGLINPIPLWARTVMKYE